MKSEEDSSDDDGDYWNRMEENGVDDEVVMSTPLAEKSPHLYEDDEEYMNDMINKDSILLDEDSIVWQILAREVAESDSTGTDFIQVTANESAKLFLLNQFLFTHLPLSSKVYGYVKTYISSESKSEASEIWTDNVRHPSVVLVITPFEEGKNFGVSVFYPYEVSDKSLLCCCQVLKASILRYNGIEEMPISLTFSGLDSRLLDGMEKSLSKLGLYIFRMYIYMHTHNLLKCWDEGNVITEA